MSNAAAATVEPVVASKPKTEKRKKPKRQPRYNVILWNDDDHTFTYVMAMLLEIFGHPLEKGYQLAQEVDSSGRAILLTTTKEHAELKRDQVHAYGKDQLIKECKGSMWCSIEPIDES